MNKVLPHFNKTILLAAAAITITAGSVHADSTWQRIDAAPGTTLVNGALREYTPGCALPNPDDGTPNDYSFYFKPGKEDKLIVYFNGGGACWNATTCLTSLRTPGATPAYVPSDEAAHNDPTRQQGIFDLANNDNDHADWSMLYLPYCTGDIHVGSNDAFYGAPFPVRHRGFDNFLAARDWLTEHYKGDAPDKILVAGSSAGAYGAALNYGHIKDVFPESKGYLIADGGSGVVNDSFLQTAITDSWAIGPNLPTSVPNLAGIVHLDASTFTPAVYSALTSHYEKDRFSQYTTVFDLIQVMFLNIMNHPNDWQNWANGEVLGPLFPYWAGTMMHYSHTLANADNYRFFIAPGCKHTILRSNDIHITQTGGTSAVQWINSLSQGKKDTWQNLNCAYEGCASEQALLSLDFKACAMIPQN